MTANSSSSDPVLRVENLSVEFDMDRGVAGVLDDVSITIERGEVLGIVGESGSGKSMFASAMLDSVVDPGVVSGDITFYPTDGEPVDVLDQSERELRRFRWEEIAMVFQGAMSSFNPVQKIATHFEETLDAHDVPIERGMERGRDILTDLHLDADLVLDSYPHELSGGMKQRALIALSLVLNPDVLVMDEPTAALDLLMQRSIISLLDEVQAEYDITLLFITHDLPLVRGLCDRLAVLYAFEIVEVGATESVFQAAYHPYTRALLNATPNLETPIEEMRPVEGEAPDPVTVPSGCSYHPRCPMATERCSAEDPPLEAVDGDHRVSCFYWDDVDEEVPLTITGSEEVSSQ